MKRQLWVPLRGRTNAFGKDAVFHRSAFPDWKFGYGVDLEVGPLIRTVVSSKTIRANT